MKISYKKKKTYTSLYYETVNSILEVKTHIPYSYLLLYHFYKKNAKSKNLQKLYSSQFSTTKAITPITVNNNADGSVPAMLIQSFTKPNYVINIVLQFFT